jgi:hypothetical protein
MKLPSTLLTETSTNSSYIRLLLLSMFTVIEVVATEDLSNSMEEGIELYQGNVLLGGSMGQFFSMSTRSFSFKLVV